MPSASTILIYGGLGAGAAILISRYLNQQPTPPSPYYQQRQSGGGGGGADYSGIIGAGFGFLNNILGRFSGASFDGSSAADNSTNGFDYGGGYDSGYPYSLDTVYPDYGGGYDYGQGYDFDTGGFEGGEDWV